MDAPRLQFAIRTLLEITFVVAVVLAFVYWRSPAPAKPEPTRRYELHVDPTEFDRQVIFDIRSGDSWRRSPGSGEWYKSQALPYQGP